MTNFMVVGSFDRSSLVVMTTSHKLKLLKVTVKTTFTSLSFQTIKAGCNNQV